MKPWLGEDEQAAAAEAVASGWVAQGPRVEAFERAFAARIGSGHAVALSSCTAALHLALLVAGVGPGDDVVVPSLSFIATANAARYVGATPVFAEVDEATGNVTPATVEAALTPHARAVIAVDQAGMPCDVAGIRAVCDPRGIVVVEDAACAAGATVEGRAAGAAAALSTFSFHPRKVITTGEGGMAVVQDEAQAARVRRLREHAMSVSAAARHAGGAGVIEEYLEVGYNYRMTDVQAAIGLVQLAKLDAIVARRRELADRYRRMLADLPGVRVPVEPLGVRTNYQSFWVELAVGGAAERNAVLAAMQERGISCRRGIMAAHREPAYHGELAPALPVTDRLTERTVILPLYHEMSAAEQERVVDALRECTTR
ncbi:MAG TPA: DegT/DnrJ/EryC1/StrS family aminotransferase [Acidimicrobiales bacterium]|nr:DegT/DnrJ/EryC1/StrS family aminotransferase [Acidimicrobiales bacterium]